MSYGTMLNVSMDALLSSHRKDPAMTTLTVTTRGQVTFGKDILQHLGIRPGGKIALNLLPDGKAELVAVRPKGSFRDLHGFLEGKTNCTVLTVEEINEAVTDAGAIAGANKV
jgi:bifunctional DNA-binding transcriptional regulator/antitoxin component of YhaV-PrlF toxin-antitoxin module